MSGTKEKDRNRRSGTKEPKQDRTGLGSFVIVDGQLLLIDSTQTRDYPYSRVEYHNEYYGISQYDISN